MDDRKAGASRTSALGFPPLYFSIRFNSFSSVTFSFTFCFGVRSPLSCNNKILTEKSIEEIKVIYMLKKTYCRITAMTQRSSSDCPLPWRVSPLLDCIGLLNFQGKVGGRVDDR